jgi:hypothetical protein
MKLILSIFINGFIKNLGSLEKESWYPYLGAWQQKSIGFLKWRWEYWILHKTLMYCYCTTFYEGSEINKKILSNLIKLSMQKLTATLPLAKT